MFDDMYVEGFRAFCEPTKLFVVRVCYYRYDERTGERQRYAVSEIFKDPKYYTKTGERRKSIRIGGKRFYLER